ncbi:hypothetical protein BJX61DRAFT_285202 [Aspergillus egyptiacus]|nr:hypothetical protein BJX61DRAFT_285202 [Aspergillus egyptiacus]
MEVIPASLIDQPTPVHNVRTRTFFIVDGRQDEAVLKDALDSLIRDHWRKLGARLVRRAKDGFLEYHLPKTFADDYSLFRWSSTHLEKSIDTCPELSFYNNPPPAENGISFLPSMWSIDKVVRPASWPMERKEEPPNDPLLYVHLTVFTDATVIATSIPHALADQFGVGNIMRAWFGLTRGETPPAMVGHDEDIMASVGKDVSEYSREEISRKGKARLQWPLESLFVMLGFLGDLIWYPSERSHIVFFPRSFVQQLRARYSKELEAEYGADPGLSSGDVILGVLAKVRFC